MGNETDRVKRLIEEKKNRRRQQKAHWKRENHIERAKEVSNSKEAVRQRIYRQRKIGKKIRSTEYQRRWRLKKKADSETVDIAKFPNRQNKARAIKRFKQSLPRTPSKRAATVAAYLQDARSPVVRTLRKKRMVSSPEDARDCILSDSVMADIRKSLSSKKKRRSDELRIEVNSVLASVCGETVSKNKCKVRLAEKLGLPARTVSKGHRIRTQVDHTDQTCLKYTKRKARASPISDETKKRAYEYWISPESSHPTGNKNDIKRVRLGVKNYSSHPVYVLRKTQTEVYIDFKERYPDTIISQRSFERSKPYFVREARKKDRVTCCCRYHLEMKSVFRACMEFRRKHVPDETVRVYDTMYDMCNDTLCKPNESGEYNKTCLERTCEKCGIKDDMFDESELSLDENAPTVSWEAFEYQELKSKRGTTRKLMLVKRETKPGELFKHAAKLLKTFPAHNFRAKWQHLQFANLLENLPMKDCVTVHDFSENYQCNEKVEIQSSYFQKTEVSIHVTLLYRHAVFEIDGIKSTPENPEIVCEHFFVISPDEQHDHHFTHTVQDEVANYLKSISYTVNTMHEFCDGCAAQYKSRFCYGDLSTSVSDFGYKTIIRNFYETSHAKGPQDAAGGYIKRQADLGILRGRAVIQNAQDFYNYAVQNLVVAKSNGCQRRIFKYCPKINRDNQVDFRPVKGIRSTHQVVVQADKPQRLNTRSLSCYQCETCIVGQTDICEKVDVVGKQQAVQFDTELTRADDDNDESLPLSQLVSKDTLFAVFCEDQDYDYYIVRALSKEIVLEKDETDDWGTTWHSGSSIIKGHYYEKCRSPLKNKLIKNRTAIVHSASVIYILDITTQRQSWLNINEDDHLRILHVLNALPF